jgi:hypothetical protein
MVEALIIAGVRSAPSALLAMAFAEVVNRIA